MRNVVSAPALARLVVGVVLAAGFTACGSDEPIVMPDVLGKKLDGAKTAVKDAGFEDEVEVEGGGMFGIVVESNWEVCEQEPAAGKEMSGTPRLVVDRSCEEEDSEAAPEESGDGEADDESPEPEESESPEPEESESPSPEPEADPIITPQNNKEFAALIRGGECDERVAGFAKKYRGQTLKFNGWIAAMAPHGNYTTRYDILVMAGNYDPSNYENSDFLGPSFQFKDVNTVGDMNWAGKIEDSVGVGAELGVTAEILGFNADTCLFGLEPVETRFR